MSTQQTGLTSTDASQALSRYGFNEVGLAKKPLWKKLLNKAKSPITLMLVLAGVLSWVNGKYFDAIIIAVLLVLNIGLEFWQEHRADVSLTELQKKLVVQTKTLRDGQWQMVESRLLVPGDVVSVGVGDIVPADARIEHANNVSLDQSALIGESLPAEKQTGDVVLSGSFVNTGHLVAIVTATGSHTQYGKILMHVQGTKKRSLLERDVIRIATFLSVISLSSVVVLDLFLVLLGRTTLVEALRLNLSLVIAGVPVSLPTVMALIISIGVVAVSKKGAIVRRMSALQNLANVTLLLSDKTGTLTANQLKITGIRHYGDYSDDDVLRLAATAAQQETRSVIDDTIKAAAAAKKLDLQKPTSVIPADSDRKRNTAIVGGSIVVSGAPFVVLDMVSAIREVVDQCQKDVQLAAEQGYRAIAIATRKGSTAEKDLSLSGLILLSDEPRSSTKSTLEFMQKEGITVKMVTGDALPIAKRVAAEVGIRGRIGGRTDFSKSTDRLGWLNDHGGIAEALPDDKFALVKSALGTQVVAVTGDGVNDLPAMSAADVGVAVEGAVDAARSSADIVLTRSGLSAIKDVIIEARTIFARLYGYSVYRISESFRLIISIALLGIIYGDFPLNPLQIILIAFLNDVPIISLAYDRVLAPHRPAKINARQRFVKSTLFGLVGVANSLIMFLLMHNIWHLPIEVIQSAYFLKLTVSGHMLIYVAHTEQRWWRFLPGKPVIWATSVTQLLATALVTFGWLTTSIPLWLVLVVWIWSFGWMQAAELVKGVNTWLGRRPKPWSTS